MKKLEIWKIAYPKQKEWLSPFEIEWHNKNIMQLKALVNGIKYILEND